MKRNEPNLPTAALAFAWQAGKNLENSNASPLKAFAMPAGIFGRTGMNKFVLS